MYDETLGQWHFWLSMISFNVTFFPMLPRARRNAAPDRRLSGPVHRLNEVATIGAFGFGLSQILFLYIVLKCLRFGAAAPARPWEGAETLEWTLPSPAPYHTFETPPVVS